MLSLSEMSWDEGSSLIPIEGQGQMECEIKELQDFTDLDEITCQVFHDPYPTFTKMTKVNKSEIKTSLAPDSEPIDYDDLLALEDIFAGWNAAMSPIIWKMPKINEINRPAFTPVLIGDEVIEKFKQSWRYPEKVEILPPSLRANSIAVVKKVWEHPCEICGVKLKGGLQRYEAHKKNAHDLSCICGEKFRHRLTLSSHLKKKMGMGKHGIVPGEKVKALYECDLCEEFFRSSATATRHRNKIHFGESGKSSRVVKRQTKRSKAKKRTSTKGENKNGSSGRKQMAKGRNDLGKDKDEQIL